MMEENFLNKEVSTETDTLLQKWMKYYISFLLYVFIEGSPQPGADLSFSILSTAGENIGNLSIISFSLSSQSRKKSQSLNFLSMANKV